MRPLASKTGITSNTGSALFLALGYLAAISILATTFVTAAHRGIGARRLDEKRAVTRALAEAGVMKAAALLRTHGEAYTGESQTPLGDGWFSTRVEIAGSNVFRIETTAELLSGETVIHRARVVATATISNADVAFTAWHSIDRWRPGLEDAQ